jgi:hypothetical protein
MRFSTLVPCGIILVLAMAAPAAAARLDVYDVHLGTVSGIKTEGPAAIRFIGINPVRYTATLTVNETTQAAPTPPAALIGQGTVTPASGTSLQNASQKTLDGLRAQLDADVTPAIGAAQSDLDPLASAVDNAFATQDQVAAINASSAFTTAQADFTKLRDKALPEIKSVEAQMAQATGSDASRAALTTTIATDRSAITSLLSTYPFVVRGFTDSDIQRERTVSCGALLGGSSTSVVTLTLTSRASATDTQASDVTVLCLGRVAVSGGFIFSSLAQQAFVAQPTNSALPSPPPAMATIQLSSSSSIRAIPIAFVHVSPSESCGEQCFFLSFGAGFNTGASTTGTTVDFAGGVTYSLARYVFITTGANLGQVNQLAPGYHIGDPIAAGAQVPTVTRTQTGFFVGITFGGR